MRGAGSGLTPTRFAPGDFDVWTLYIDPDEPTIPIYSIRSFVYLLCSAGTEKLYLGPVAKGRQDAYVELAGPYRQSRKPGDGPVQLRASYTLLRATIHDNRFGLDDSEKQVLATGVVSRLDLSLPAHRDNGTRFLSALDLEAG